MASKRPNNFRHIGFYFKKKKADSANGVNNQPDAKPNSSDDVTNKSHVTKNCSDRVAKQSSPLPNADAAPSTSPSTTFQDEQSSVSNAADTNQHGKNSVLSLSKEDVIKMIEDQFPNAVVHDYYLCNSKYCTDISANEATRLNGEKKKFLHTWIQDKENVWLCLIEGSGMFCLLCKKHQTQCERNKDEETFIQVACTRLKLQSINRHNCSHCHKSSIQNEQLQRVSFFH